MDSMKQETWRNAFETISLNPSGPYASSPFPSAHYMPYGMPMGDVVTNNGDAPPSSSVPTFSFLSTSSSVANSQVQVSLVVSLVTIVLLLLLSPPFVCEESVTDGRSTISIKRIVTWGVLAGVFVYFIPKFIRT